MYLFRKFTGFALASLILIAVLGCERDFMDPLDDINSENKSSNSDPQFSNNSTVHVSPYTYCGVSGTANLISESGSQTITYCPGGPCTGTQNTWGTATYSSGVGPNGDNVMEFQISMTPGWAVVGVDIKMGNTYDFQLSNSIPTNTGVWESATTAPLQDFALNIPVGDNAQCFLFAAKITVCKFGFLTGADPNSYTDLWVHNPNFVTSGNTPSEYLTPYCAPVCGSLLPPARVCAALPPIPNPSCTKTPCLNNVQVKNACDVVCINTSGNMSNVQFRKAGTLIIGQGQVVSGGINANKGGRLIVKGEFNWTGNSNIGKDFEIFVAPGGKINRVGSFNFNQANNKLVNYGSFNCNQNLVFKGEVFNEGIMKLKGINANSNNAKLVNSGKLKLSHTLNLNCGASFENCGIALVKCNLHINNGAYLSNKGLLWVKGSAHNNGTLSNYGNMLVKAASGNSSGLFLQGKTNLFDHSLLISPRLTWSPNEIIEVNGSPSILVTKFDVDSDKTITNLFGKGRFKVQNNVQVTGTGYLRIMDIDPQGQGDIPTGGSFPVDVLSRMQIDPTVSVGVQQMDPILEVANWNGVGI